MESADYEVYERQPSPNVKTGMSDHGVIRNTYNTPSYEEALLLSISSYVIVHTIFY